MALKIEDHDLNCYALDEDTAVLKVLHENYVVDYSTLMEMVMNLLSVAARMEVIQQNPPSPNPYRI